MIRALAIALLAILLAPSASAQGEDPAYPAELLELLPVWLAEAQNFTRPADREQPWWPEAEGFLVKGTTAAEAGRLRVAMFHLETFIELVAGYQLMDDARAAGSDAEQRAFISQRTQSWHADGERAWSAYRARLHGYDGQLRSLTAIEKALYASDVALTAAVALEDHETLVREFPKQTGVPPGYVLALVRASHTPLVSLGWAEDLLEKAVATEGLPPRVVDERWTNLTTAALGITGEAPTYMESLDKIARPVRENDEAILAVAISLAEQRAGRAHGMQIIFGDAETNGLPVVRDSARGMNRQLNNTSLELPRSYGLLGVFTSDAIDRARFTNEFVENGTATLGTVILGWSALEHASYATNALAGVSPVQPQEPTQEREAPAAGALWALVALAVLALARRR